MSTVLLVRHGLTPLTGPVLAGWTPGVHLDERGRAQAAALGERLLAVPLAAVVVSPLERCRETAAAILAGRDPAPPLHVDEQVGEVRYGSWTGRELRALRKEPLWAVVQGHPSAVVFPDGEGLAAMSARAVAAVRRWNAELGPDATYALVSHGDVIKAILADALGLHLDAFGRIGVDPCSLSVVRYGAGGRQVERVNDTGGSVVGLAPSDRAMRIRTRTRTARGEAR
ncbi:MAG: MSMEG_4193 family putative phosphomutase [Chloroflexota bacterium]